MFKRFRNNRIKIKPPPAPTIEEIVSDLETFQSQICNNIKKNDNETSKEQQWWQDFEFFAAGHDNLILLEKEICVSKEKLEKYKMELESKTTTMKKEIQIQKAQINDLSK